MAMERSTAEALPLPPRLSASPPSSPATVGALLTNAAGVSRIRRECRSPRSLLSRILGRGGGGFGCRMRIPRYCSSGAGAAVKEDAVEEEVAVLAPKVVVASKQEAEVRESPRSSLQGMKAAPDQVSAASLGLGAGLVLLLSRGAAELSRMAELRAQMERLVLDVRAEARGSSRSDVSDGRADDGASVVKERIVLADGGGGEDASLSRGSGDAASACGDAGVGNAAAAMDQMEAELEAELTRLQLDSDSDHDDEEECVRPRRDHQLESDAKSDISSESGSPACVDIDGVVTDAATECKEHEDNEEEEDTEEDEEDSKPCHGGVPARVLERRLHELLQSRHEERIAELETELQRAQRKLREKEREVSRWRDTAKLVSRHKDESLLR
ncbi:protein POLAR LOCALIZATION DURING ASYMMETRIC DIVISION AND REDISTRIBUTION-like [Hordeum vulgare subsp. vulgare]|uniref:Uncharacterized protein n=1 Tax=Hordeum vulgare subsp. vulgare TaxID=112509 RepID=A0A8I7BCL8_HORVV|nr:protein POLAR LOCALIZATION DURING ASYMMETRIC DIVISION AND REDISTRIBUTION-like [Hordeum vulgare subsp. vulgare]